MGHACRSGPLLECSSHIGRRSTRGRPHGRSLRAPEEGGSSGGADGGVPSDVGHAQVADGRAGRGGRARGRAGGTDRQTALGRLSIPAIGLDAGIIPVGVTRAGHLAIGRSVRDVYRWRSGVLPGQEGSAVLAGHTWSKGPGVFDDLGRLRPGNLVVVGRNRFEVSRVRRVTGMSRSAVAALFSDRGAPRLTLMTCGDRNDLTGVYRTRIIVTARLLPSR